jgi:hypothetical protein
MQGKYSKEAKKSDVVGAGMANVCMLYVYSKYRYQKHGTVLAPGLLNTPKSMMARDWAGKIWPEQEGRGKLSRVRIPDYSVLYTYV